jgi:hypothetical protein
MGGAQGDYAPRKVRFDAISEAFGLLKDQMGTWVLTMLVYLGIMFGISFVIGLLLSAVGLSTRTGSGQAPNIGAMIFVQMISFVLNLALSGFLLGGLYRMALKQVRGQAIAVGDLFSGADIIGSMIGAALLYVLAVYLGAIFLIIPGLLLAGLLMLTFPLIADQRAGVIDAMKMSFAALKGDMWSALGFFFVAGIVSSLGALLCGVGLLFTAPIQFLATAIVYQDFFGRREGIAEPGIQMPLPPQSPLPRPLGDLGAGDR